MNPKLNDLFKTFNQLCTGCENWTTDECDICGDSYCESCLDYHYQEEHDDEEK